MYIDSDFIRESIVSGFAQPSLPVTEDFVRQTSLQREIVIAWAESMTRAGFVPVDDAPIPSPEEFTDQYTSFWNDPKTVCVMLIPDPDEVRRRIAERNGPFDDFLIGVVDRSLESIARLDLSDWHTVDSTGQSSEETAEAVVALVR